MGTLVCVVYDLRLYRIEFRLCPVPRTITSAWTRVEIQLHQIFTISLSLTIRQPGGGWSSGTIVPQVVLEAIDGFRAKVLMIDAAITASLADLDEEAADILAAWAKEKRKVQDLHGNRNKLAHWTVSAIWEDDVRQAVKLTPQYFSRAWRIDASGASVGVTASDVKVWQKSFEDAASRLCAICERLAAHRGLQHKFLRLVAFQVRASLPENPEPLELLKRELSAQELPSP